MVPPVARSAPVRRARRTALVVGGQVGSGAHRPDARHRAPGLGGGRQWTVGRQRRPEPQGDGRPRDSRLAGSARPLRRSRGGPRAGAVGALGRHVRRGAPHRGRLEPRSRATSGVRGDPRPGGGAGRPAARRAACRRRCAARRPGRRHDDHALRVGRRRGARPSRARRSAASHGRARGDRRGSRRDDADPSRAGHGRARPGPPRDRRSGDGPADPRPRRDARRGRVARRRRARLAEPCSDGARGGRRRPRGGTCLGRPDRGSVLGLRQRRTRRPRMRGPPGSRDQPRRGDPPLHPP